MLSVPSKAFLIGEYAVLDGAPALVSTFAPRFGLANIRPGVSDSHLFHPDSPAGRLLKSNPLSGEFRDPHHGVGGFGGSTAEFLLAYAASVESQNKNNIWDAWSRYREFTPSASGADLVAQWVGGAVAVDLKKRSAEQLNLDEIGKCILVFSAAHQENRKVRTHEHLNSGLEKFQASDHLSHFKELIESAIDAFSCGDAKRLASSMNLYGDALRAQGLEISQTTQDREALAKVPGVIGVKGTGALQADGLVVVMDPEFARESEKKEHVVRSAEALDLRVVARELKREAGIQFE